MQVLGKSRTRGNGFPAKYAISRTAYASFDHFRPKVLFKPTAYNTKKVTNLMSLFSHLFCLMFRILLVYHAVLKLCKLGAVPAACCSYEVAGDTLELVNLGALAMRTFLEVCVSVFKSAVKTSVAVVVY